MCVGEGRTGEANGVGPFVCWGGTEVSTGRIGSVEVALGKGVGLAAALGVQDAIVARTHARMNSDQGFMDEVFL